MWHVWVPRWSEILIFSWYFLFLLDYIQYKMIYRWEKWARTWSIGWKFNDLFEKRSFNRYRRKRPKVDASIFDSALSHTRRSDASEKREEKSVSTFGRFRLWTSFESSPVSDNVLSSLFDLEWGKIFSKEPFIQSKSFSANAFFENVIFFKSFFAK